MADTTVKKIDSSASPCGPGGQKYLATGKHIGMRLWQKEHPGDIEPPHRRDYETLGYVIAGRAELHIEGQMILLNPGDSWLVPRGSEHAYRILEPFTAVEVTCPPSHVHGRDEPIEPKAGESGQRAA
jgi:quercetin dioxygenase-like cupin family protein